MKACFAPGRGPREVLASKRSAAGTPSIGRCCHVQAHRFGLLSPSQASPAPAPAGFEGSKVSAVGIENCGLERSALLLTAAAILDQRARLRPALNARSVLELRASHDILSARRGVLKGGSPPRIKSL